MDIVLNWIWQGAVVAAATAIVLATMSPARAPTRYVVAWAGLVSVLALPLTLTFSSADPAAIASIAGVAPAGTSSTLPYLSIPDRWLMSGAAISAAWLGWVTLNGISLLVAMLALRRAKRECHPLPAEIEEQLPHWLDIRRSGRRATIVISAAVQHAAVLGGARTIAIAPHLVDRLDRDDLDRIVIHEWAHVQRRDDIAQAALLVIRMIAGWHPAIWWLNRQIAIEREIACDQLAVAVTGSPKKYAACLMRLAAIPSPSFSPAVGLHVLTLLHNRILRVLSLKDVRPQGTHVPAAVAAATMLIGTGLGVGQFHLIVTAQSPSVGESVASRSAMVRLTTDAANASDSATAAFPCSRRDGPAQAGHRDGCRQRRCASPVEAGHCARREQRRRTGPADASHAHDGGNDS